MADNSAYKILVLEDIPGESELIQHEIRKSGIPINCQTASNKKDFIEKMLSFHPDLIISDDSNTELNGLDIISSVRFNLPDAKLIMVSIDCSYDKIVQYFAMGADNVVYYDHIVFLASVVKRLYRTKSEMEIRSIQTPKEYPPDQEDPIVFSML